MSSTSVTVMVYVAEAVKSALSTMVACCWLEAASYTLFKGKEQGVERSRKDLSKLNSQVPVTLPYLFQPSVTDTAIVWVTTFS